MGLKLLPAAQSTEVAPRPCRICLHHQGHQQGCCQHQGGEGSASSTVGGRAARGGRGGRATRGGRTARGGRAARGGASSWGICLELARSQGGDGAVGARGVHGAVGGVGLECLCAWERQDHCQSFPLTTVPGTLHDFVPSNELKCSAGCVALVITIHVCTSSNRMPILAVHPGSISVNNTYRALQPSTGRLTRLTGPIA
jgi:hypothetical protein